MLTSDLLQAVVVLDPASFAYLIGIQFGIRRHGVNLQIDQFLQFAHHQLVGFYDRAERRVPLLIQCIHCFVTYQNALLLGLG